MTDIGTAEYHGNTTWSFERTALLASRWNDGYSAGQIAAEFGMTRNSIIGKIHRLKLPSRTTQHSVRYKYSGRSLSREEKAARQAARRGQQFFINVRQKSLPPAPLLEVVVEPQIPPRGIGLLDLQRGECRFPFGEGPFTFCGHSATHGPYCRAHHEVTHNPPQTKGALGVLMGTVPARLQPAATGSSR